MAHHTQMRFSAMICKQDLPHIDDEDVSEANTYHIIYIKSL